MTPKIDKTTFFAYLAAFAAFVAFAPELFPREQLWGLWVQKIAAFVAAGGLIGFGHAAKDTNKGSDRPQEVADAKLDNVAPIDTIQFEDKG